MKKLLLLFLLSICAGCDSVSTVSRPADYQSQAPQPATGLFPQDNAKADNTQIAQALAYQLKLPVHVRIAVIQLADSGSLPGVFTSRAYDDAALRTSYADFFDTLKQSPRVYDASFFPRMLMPSTMDMDSLRGSAARYQADLLLLYRSRCDVNDKNHLLTPSEVQADCVVEAVMLDVRSGLIAFSSVADQSLHAVKSKEDFDFDATVQKAHTTAIDKALVQIAGDADKFLAGVPSF